MLDLPALKHRIDAIAADARRTADALATHATLVSDPVLHGQLHRLETAMREAARAIAEAPVPAALS
jgi:hypothetical protein